MKIFLDTANVEEIKEGVSWGIVDGVTTNPTLISKETRDGKTFMDIVEEILKIVPGPVSLEVISTDTEGMVREARKLAELGDNATIKIPMTVEGLKAVKILSKEGIMTNVTLVFSPNQAILAAKAGATFVSPFVGRMDDIGHDGMEIVADIHRIYRNYGFKTEVIVASVRHPRHVYEAALIGADIVTMPFRVLKFMVKHPKTDEGIERFLADWSKVPKEGLPF